jgi:hypothetical protein
LRLQPEVKAAREALPTPSMCCKPLKLLRLVQ